MKSATRLVLPTLLVAAVALLCFSLPARPVAAGPKSTSYWRVDDVRRGMKGTGRTVLKGTKVETFQVEVLGVLKNTSPGRDLVLARLSGCNLDKTGVIAGMSGSPVYIGGKLLGAVAYAWPFGKEPIAGITPFSQMHGFVESFERRDVAARAKTRRVGLREPLKIGGKSFNAVTVSQGFDDDTPKASDGLWMAPLRTPLAATGFTRNSLKLFANRCGRFGLVPMQGGGASAKVAEEEKDTPLQAGGPLSVSLITGDFDLSGIGTVTHIEGNRVYGWGHPFMSLGECEFPLMTGYIHAVYPRQTVSFKMGSPLRTVGVINADVSTCIAGWLDRKPDMLPVRMSVTLGKGAKKTFNVQTVRQRSLLASLVFTALTNSVDMEGELPEEMTAKFTARVELEGRDPIIIKDTFSGFSGGRAPHALYGPVASVVNLLAYNPYKPVRIKRIECDTHVVSGRISADIDSVELDSETYLPGDTVKATVYLVPYKGLRQRVRVALKLPADLPEGHYTATVCDDLTNARLTLRGDPTLYNPSTVKQVLEALKVQTSAKRTNLVMRVPIGACGVASGGKSLRRLPASMVHILANSRRTGAQTMTGAVVARRSTEWVIQGAETVRFSVTKTRKVTRQDEW
jgi:hypothetical protein